MFIKISDFARERGVKRDTINAYIRKHPEIESETTTKGKDKFIDNESAAYKELNQKYPKMELDANSLQQELNDAYKQIAALSQELLANAKLVAKADAQLVMFEEMKYQLEDKSNEIHELIEENKNKENQIKQLEDELNVEQNRKLSFKERFFGRKEKN